MYVFASATMMVHDNMVSPAAVEDVADVAQQDDGRILVVVLAGPQDGSLSGPLGPIGAERIRNGDQGAPVVGLAIAQWRANRTTRSTRRKTGN